MKPKISLVIALYNTEKEIDVCLKSIFDSDFKDFEIIIVNDCSTDNSLKVAKKYPCKFFSTKTNSGSGAARNLGVSKAKSEIIFFLDSDTKVETDSIKKIYQTFVDQPDIWATIALPKKDSLRNSNASHYNAIKNNYTLFTSNPYTNYFTTQMGAIRKKKFEKLGGFNETLKIADKKYGFHALDDIELGPRIPKGKVFINKEVTIWHQFPFFSSILKKYYKRAIMLTHVFKKTKKLSASHANKKGMIAILFAVTSLFFFLFSFLNPIILFLSLFCFFFFLLLNFKLFTFTTSKKGIFYLFESIFFEFIFSLAIGIGGIIGNITFYIKKQD